MRVGDRVRRVTRVAVRGHLPLAQNRIPPREPVREPQQDLADYGHDRSRNPRHAEEWGDRHTAIDLVVLRAPRREQTTEREPGNGYALAEFPSHGDVLVDRGVQIVGAKVRERG